MSVFPVQEKQDSKYYTEEKEDVSMSSEMEGGYTSSRPRHTRKARRMFTTGFSSISDANKQLLDDFIDEVKGGSNSFSWSNPVTQEVLTVRIQSGKMPKAKYVGYGGTHLWNYTGFNFVEV